jgi:riboflavin kinase/FMN adenylyltransferase
MQLLRTYHSSPPHLHHAVVAIGNFDGVHRGHYALLMEAKAVAAAKCVPWMVMTFHPHPRHYFMPDVAPFALESFAMRLRRLRNMNPDGVLVMRFNAAMAAMRAETFVQDVLVGQMRISHVVVGEDFCYGARREGNVNTLQQAARLHQFGCTYLPPVMVEGVAVSSSRIRALLSEGDMAGAARLLGRPYSLSGRVQHGNKRGRELGTPTVNLSLHGLHVPRYGVYAARLHISDTNVQAVVNIGVRPTFGGDAEPHLEAHSLQPLPELYGQKLRIELLHFIRNEQRFDNAIALQAQIKHDIACTMQYFTEGRMV